MVINEQYFVAFNLNLMTTFAVLYRECSVSEAARCLGVKQPAVSNALMRLRVHFRDPLFVRKGLGMRPTSKAQRIANVLMPAMTRIEPLLMSSH